MQIPRHTWITLLRGINVGGNNIVPMKELRDLLSGLGFENARTYIQSGNCVFDSDITDTAVISEKISKAMQTAFGFEPNIMCLNHEDFAAAITQNPYPDVTDLKALHFFFLAEPARNADLEALNTLKKLSENYSLTENVFYLHAPDGIGRSKLAAQAERKLGVRATGRNLRSVMKIAELAGLDPA